MTGNLGTVACITLAYSYWWKPSRTCPSQPGINSDVNPRPYTTYVPIVLPHFHILYMPRQHLLYSVFHYLVPYLKSLRGLNQWYNHGLTSPTTNAGCTRLQPQWHQDQRCEEPRTRAFVGCIISFFHHVPGNCAMLSLSAVPQLRPHLLSHVPWNRTVWAQLLLLPSLCSYGWVQRMSTSTVGPIELH
jgi:hypothetical protein